MAGFFHDRGKVISSVAIEPRSFLAEFSNKSICNEPRGSLTFASPVFPFRYHVERPFAHRPSVHTHGTVATDSLGWQFHRNLIRRHCNLTVERTRVGFEVAFQLTGFLARHPPLPLAATGIEITLFTGSSTEAGIGTYRRKEIHER